MENHTATRFAITVNGQTVLATNSRAERMQKYRELTEAKTEAFTDTDYKDRIAVTFSLNTNGKTYKATAKQF